MKYFLLLIPLLFFSCNPDSQSYDYDEDDGDPRDEAVEEKSDFERVLDADFETTNYPYKAATNFDNYAPDEYLTRKQFDILMLDYVFPEGYERERYSAGHNIATDKDYKMIVVYSEDTDHELSTYLVTYDNLGWYIDNLRIAYDENAEGFLDMKATVKEDKILRTTTTYFADEAIKDVETYYVRNDGTFLWEEDR